VRQPPPRTISADGKSIQASAEEAVGTGAEPKLPDYTSVGNVEAGEKIAALTEELTHHEI
jgi:hypothetical protein